MRLSLVTLPFAAPLVLAAACSNDDTHPPVDHSIPTAGVNTSSGGAGDSGLGDDADASACSVSTNDGGSYDIAVNTGFASPGEVSYAFDGIIAFPAALASGQAIVFTVSSQAGDKIQPLTKLETASDGPVQFTYRVTGLSAGNYRVRAQLDADNNASLTDASDWDGYYTIPASSPASPVIDPSAAALVPASTSCHGLNFAIGLRSNAAPVGP